MLNESKIIQDRTESDIEDYVINDNIRITNSLNTKINVYSSSNEYFLSTFGIWYNTSNKDESILIKRLNVSKILLTIKYDIWWLSNKAFSYIY